MSSCEIFDIRCHLISYDLFKNPRRIFSQRRIRFVAFMHTLIVLYSFSYHSYDQWTISPEL